MRCIEHIVQTRTYLPTYLSYPCPSIHTYPFATTEPLTLWKIPCLSAPQLGDQLGDANVVCLERVEGDAQGDGADAEGPHAGGVQGWHAAAGEVVDDAGSEEKKMLVWGGGFRWRSWLSSV